MDANSQIFVTSVSKAIDKAKVTGSMDVVIPRIYRIITEYLEWIKAIRDAGDDKYDLHIFYLQNKLVDIRRKYPLEICNYKTIIGICGNVPNLHPDGSNNNQGNTNVTAPTVIGVTIALSEDEQYTFKKEDFTNQYSDAQGNPPYKVMVYSSLMQGSLEYNGNPIAGVFELEMNEIENLVYIRSSEEEFNTTFNFRISDLSSTSTYSNLATNTITGALFDEGVTVIGDYSITVEPNVTTVLKINMFTTDTNPEYNDPEGDLIDAIRIDRIHNTNIGKFYLSGIEISDGIIITREQIISEQFTHVSVDPEDILTDGFEFSGRDEGSMNWVQ
jgi:hypothetical protein